MRIYDRNKTYDAMDVVSPNDLPIGSSFYYVIISHKKDIWGNYAQYHCPSADKYYHIVESKVIGYILDATGYYLSEDSNDGYYPFHARAINAEEIIFRTEEDIRYYIEDNLKDNGFMFLAYPITFRSL